MATHRDFMRSTGHRGPHRTPGGGVTTYGAAEYSHPNSVFKSLVDYSRWIERLRISPVAKRLTRLRGRHFRLAVQKILTHEQS